MPGVLPLICAYPPLALKKGDRVEPTPEVLDVYVYLEMEAAPAQVKFWRRKAETEALRRNPLLTPELGLDLARVVAIDAMHTLCLGVHHQFVMSALWWYVDTHEPTDDLLRVQASRHSANMAVFAKDYKTWTQMMRQTSPDVLITTLGDLNMDVIGTKSKPESWSLKGKFFGSYLSSLQIFFATGSEMCAKNRSQLKEVLNKSEKGYPCIAKSARPQLWIRIDAPAPSRTTSSWRQPKTRRAEMKTRIAKKKAPKLFQFLMVCFFFGVLAQALNVRMILAALHSEHAKMNN